MYFKPRIFISSTLSENLLIRNELESFFNSIGAEVMLYEKNLTPSISPMTYRKDIIDADFVIFIIKDKYGTETESGLSGTHEELMISLENDIPKHIYIKSGNKEDNTEKLIEEINNNFISYYYFKDDNELLARIKETVFSIARDIILRKVEQADLSSVTVKKICVNHDYKVALSYLKIFGAIIEIEEKFSFDYLDNNLLMASLSCISQDLIMNKLTFADNKLAELLKDTLTEYDKFISNYVLDFSSKGNSMKIKFPILGEIRVSESVMSGTPKYSREEYWSMIKSIFDRYYEFKKYVKDMKLQGDLLNVE